MRILLILVLSMLCSTTFAQSQWQEFKSYDGRFRILAPGPMQTKIDSIETPVGTLAQHNFVYQPENPKEAENLIYMVSYYDYPEGTIPADSTDLIEAFFDETIAAAAFSINGKVQYSDAVQLDEYPGRLWRIDYLEGKAVIKTRAYLIGQRYFSTQTISLIERHINPSSDKFLDSFRLLDE